MKIITWNCNMAFRKKAPAILALKPDLLIIQECEEPARLTFDRGVRKPSGLLWFGTNPNKGLGVFSYGKYKLETLVHHEPAFRMVVPIAVTSPSNIFTLYAIWANNPTDPDGTYVEQVWKAINHYDLHLNSTPSILAGDFNSNAIWDRKRRIGNHSDVVRVLEAK